MMYLGSHYVYAKFLPDRTPNMATRGISQKRTSAISEVAMRASITKFLL
jgi:hypothetical protein